MPERELAPTAARHPSGQRRNKSQAGERERPKTKRGPPTGGGGSSGSDVPDVLASSELRNASVQLVPGSETKFPQQIPKHVQEGLKAPQESENSELNWNGHQLKIIYMCSACPKCGICRPRTKLGRGPFAEEPTPETNIYGGAGATGLMVPHKGYR